MAELTPEGRDIIQELARKYGMSDDAVLVLLEALVRGGGRAAQFSHPELGGAGQWMQGGMTQVGDMFNAALRAKVSGLCSELAALLERQPTSPSARPGADPGPQPQRPSPEASQHPPPTSLSSALNMGNPLAGSLFADAASGSGWPDEWGSPGASGSQNDMSYAYFPRHRRLAVRIGGRTTVYDTGDHRITGVAQQQGAAATLAFTSQKGIVSLADLPRVPIETAREAASAPAPSGGGPDGGAAPAGPDILAQIERLAELRDKGILTEDEFTRKKSELLDRL